jgi:hypothetical protein
MAGGYLEQYDRMHRWYAKFGDLHEGRRHDVMSENYLDEVYAFFMSCFHLKDWIKNDHTVSGTIPSIGQEVEEYIYGDRILKTGGNDHLKLCGDLCNSLKHMENRNRSRENPIFGSKQYGLQLGGEETIIKLEKFSIERDTKGPIDAFELATECLKAWDTFLSSKGLKISIAPARTVGVSAGTDSIFTRLLRGFRRWLCRERV